MTFRLGTAVDRVKSQVRRRLFWDGGVKLSDEQLFAVN